MLAITSLREGLEQEIRAQILSGQLAAGSRINEVHLAGALHVSRTPVREALTRLSGEHFVEARPRRGFFVRPLTAAEVRDLYPIRSRLDPWALELSGIPPREALAELDALNRELAAVADPERAIDLDDRWHIGLVARCPNATLLELIRQMMWRTRRYEHLYFREPRAIATAVREHAAILRALRRGDLREACRRLGTNTSTAIEELVAQLEAR